MEHVHLRRAYVSIQSRLGHPAHDFVSTYTHGKNRTPEPVVQKAMRLKDQCPASNNAIRKICFFMDTPYQSSTYCIGTEGDIRPTTINLLLFRSEDTHPAGLKTYKENACAIERGLE